MTDRDAAIRSAAMTQSAKLLREHSGAVPWEAIRAGLELDGERIYLANKARGIHKPTQMRRGALSVKTTIPRAGRSARYRDEMRSNGYFSYDFQGDDPDNNANQALFQSHADQSPLLYFSALAPGLYKIFFPSFIVQWDPLTLRCLIAVSSNVELDQPAQSRVADTPERRYSTVEAKVRLHQAEFRESVLNAYGHRCAISGLPIAELLEAAHIIPDRDERGFPEISNGLCLSRLHHTAYDCNLIGIDHDGVIHVADRVLNQKDGPTLEAIKAFHLARIRAPVRTEDHPRREYLEERFAAFKRTG